MSENDISDTMKLVWKSVGTNGSDPRDDVIFELYRQRAQYRDVVERIAAYPYKVWTQQQAQKALDAINQASGETSEENKAIDLAVNRGLAATGLDGLEAGAELMCREGVPLEISKRVLLDPSSRRASDWNSSKESAQSAFSRSAERNRNAWSGVKDVRSHDKAPMQNS